MINSVTLRQINYIKIGTPLLSGSLAAVFNSLSYIGDLDYLGESVGHVVVSFWPQKRCGVYVFRGIEPGKRLRAIPGRTLKLGETLQECSAREILEETGITIVIGECIYAFDLIERDNSGKIKYHFFVNFAAFYVSGERRRNDDATNACFLSPEELNKLLFEKMLDVLHSIGISIV